ncbi:hypothetical protein ES332_D02G167200v1 [Gossypium tomentosum]|uniref:Uncharacterized protein n=1 Tax=Gossypium tomentosum TaxID=34277 RepID=A0A5D2LY33_GOSTO|nr:hypothetical protein ES332_D02G167200v1 [Gossypium tomentosum]
MRQFVSNEAAKRFSSFDKQLISECGFNFAMQLFHDPIITRIDRLRLNTFYRQPLKPAVILIDQEFFANFPEVQDNKVFLRGMYIDISPITIEVVHKTPHYAPNFYEYLNKDEVDYEENNNFLTEDRGHGVRKLVSIPNPNPSPEQGYQALPEITNQTDRNFKHL